MSVYSETMTWSQYKIFELALKYAPCRSFKSFSLAYSYFWNMDSMEMTQVYLSHTCVCVCVSWCFTVEAFDLAAHLNTVPELVKRTFNRPMVETLEKKSIVGTVETWNIEVWAQPFFLNMNAALWCNKTSFVVEHLKSEI